jgi:hypothetical protein
LLTCKSRDDRRIRGFIVAVVQGHRRTYSCTCSFLHGCTVPIAPETIQRQHKSNSGGSPEHVLHSCCSDLVQQPRPSSICTRSSHGASLKLLQFNARGKRSVPFRGRQLTSTACTRTSPLWPAPLPPRETAASWTPSAPWFYPEALGSCPKRCLKSTGAPAARDLMGSCDPSLGRPCF